MQFHAAVKTDFIIVNYSSRLGKKILNEQKLLRNPGISAGICYLLTVIQPYEVVWMYFNIARVSLGLAVILMSGSLNFPRNYYYFLWVNVFFFQWVVSNIQQNIATPQLLSFYSKGNPKLQTPEAWTGEQAQLVPTGLKWFSFFSICCDFRSYLCLWIHASYGDLLPSRDMFKFPKWKLLRWPSRYLLPPKRTEWLMKDRDHCYLLQ